MAYTPIFTTKQDVFDMLPATLKNVYTITDIPDSMMKRGDALVWAELKRNGKYTESNVDITHIELQMATENAVLWLLAKNQVLSGLYGQSGELSNAAAANVNINFTGSKGGQLRTPQEIDQERDAPDYYHTFQRHILNYLQDPTTKGKRIDEVEPRVVNAFSRRVQRRERNRLQELFRLHE